MARTVTYRTVQINGRTLIGAAFRGVPFFVDDFDTPVGRRVAVDALPLRDVPAYDDLGRVIKELRISAYVLGATFQDDAKAVRAALDAPGPGTLLHPAYGDLRVQCQVGSERVNMAEGWVQWGLSFVVVEDSPASLPVAETPPAALGLALEDSLQTSIASAYLGDFEPTVPLYARASATAELRAVAASLDQAARAAFDDATASAQELGQFSTAVKDVILSASDLISQPQRVIDVWLTEVQRLGRILADAPDLLFSVLDAGYRARRQPAPVADTPTRQTEATNLAALEGALRVPLLVGSARAAIQGQILDRADELIEGITDEMATWTDQPEIVASLQDLRGLLRQLPSASGEEFVTADAPVPAVLLAYQEYGDPSRAVDLEALNPLADPLFMAGRIRTG